jgi:hypothetical protein
MTLCADDHKNANKGAAALKACRRILDGGQTEAHPHEKQS